jgi:hypothetical protein
VNLPPANANALRGVVGLPRDADEEWVESEYLDEGDAEDFYGPRDVARLGERDAYDIRTASAVTLPP